MIDSPTGAADARSIQCRYGSFKSSAFWCSAVGYSQSRRRLETEVSTVLAHTALAYVDDLLTFEQRVDDDRPFLERRDHASTIGGTWTTASSRLGDLRLSAHRRNAAAARAAAQGLVVCHGFPNGPRGAATVGTTYPDLADRLARDFGLRRAHVQLPRNGHVGGRLLGAGWLHDLRAAVRTLAERPDVRGVWTVGFGHGATFALCEAMNDELVRGVAAIAARDQPR